MKINTRDLDILLTFFFLFFFLNLIQNQLIPGVPPPLFSEL